MVKVSQKILFIADRHSGHLSIADTTFGNQWQFCIKIDLCIADSRYQSKILTKLQCICTNKNIIQTYLLNIKGQTDVRFNFQESISYEKHLININSQIMMVKPLRHMLLFIADTSLQRTPFPRTNGVRYREVPLYYDCVV